MLHRDYFFEFAGMPQGGKTTIAESVAHYLKRHGYHIEEHYGGSRYSPYLNLPIGDLNTLIACDAVSFLTVAAKRDEAEHKIYLLDKGIIDRYLFTEVLLRCGKIDETKAQALFALLTIPDLLNRLDGVFIFVTSPEKALEREYKNKIEKKPGEVMNESFLYTMFSVISDYCDEFQYRVKNVSVIDTEQRNKQVIQTAKDVVDTIENIIKGNSAVYNFLK